MVACVRKMFFLLTAVQKYNNNSSGDKIANVNVFTTTSYM